jgi:hypothetical protein
MRILSFTAKDHAELGEQLGEHFRTPIREKIARERHPDWDREVRQAMRSWTVTARRFPSFAREIRSYARAAGIRGQDLWAVGLEIGMDADRCTTMVTNGGTLAGHVEDFDPGTAQDLFLIRRTVGTGTVLDLQYFYTLGGNAASVNAHGWCQLVNTLHGPTASRGVPRNVIARWLSETSDPERDARRLARLPRLDGYSHTFVHASGRTLNLEVTPGAHVLAPHRAPYAHANHYLSRLRDEEAFLSGSSSRRLEVARRRLKPRMSVAGLKRVMDDRSHGRTDSIMNEDTIAKLIVDFARREARVWFKADARRGFVTVALDFLP